MLSGDTSKATDVEAMEVEVESPLDEVHTGTKDVPISPNTEQQWPSLEEEKGQDENGDDNSPPLLLWLKYARRRDVLIKVLKRLVRNPVLWGIVLGFILSLSTIGPTYLNPNKPDYYEPLGWIWYTTEWLGECVSPVSLFTMGIWMAEQGKKLFQLGPRAAFLFMLSKLVFVPLIVLGLAKAVNLKDEPGRAAVLIAALPISMASFTLGSLYDIGQKTLAANVTLGTLFLLPTIMIWNYVLDKTGVFPISGGS